jgi:epoxyqueuosine reductase
VSEAELGAWLLEEARGLGFDDAALVRADRGTPGGDALRRAAEAGRLGPLDWLVQSVEARADMGSRYPDARTVLVVVQNYYAGEHHDDDDDAPKVSRYAWGRDYHNIMRRKLRKLRKRLLERSGSDDPRAVAVFNDADPVLERAWAEAAGLGFIGKSSLFIHRGLGTWTFLGGLVCKLELGAPEPQAPARFCGSCTACLDACPTDAFTGPGELDVARCMTTWTVERPDDDAGDALVAGSGWGVGCDICQEVCPWNRFQRVTDDGRFSPKPGHAALREGALPEDLAGTPLARVGAEGLAHNARRTKRSKD